LVAVFCPTRWIVRGESIASILDIYSASMQLWEECLEERLELNVKGRIIGVQTQMKQYSILFGLKLCERVLKVTDSMSETLQLQSLSAAEYMYLDNNHQGISEYPIVGTPLPLHRLCLL